ncbi:hypothetical protein L6164_026068 [Bauhinia variegata]|uniref:Uncharacterized protein n=1 Tax=Bauhinia variegata TaxID=167791 RepID=A0ACB9M4P3_BAUVA|nr:hypothetical protein L6164_026068 [Bauhinia variegata]
MDWSGCGISRLHRPKWRKVAYGGMQPGFADNHTDESFLELMVMNASLVRRDMRKISRKKFEIHGPWDEAKLCFDITDC